MKTKEKFVVYGFIIGLLLGGAISKFIFRLLAMYNVDYLTPLNDPNNSYQAQWSRNIEKNINPAFLVTVAAGILGAIIGYFLYKRTQRLSSKKSL